MSPTATKRPQPLGSPTARSGARCANRRRRRILWVTVILLSAAAVGTLFGVHIYRSNRPLPYQPGEANEEITQSLAQPYERPSATPDIGTASGPPVGGTEDGLRKVSQALPQGAPVPRLVDVTLQAGLDSFRTFEGERTSQLPEDMGSGAAWGDFDNDGYEDLFLVSAGGPLDAPVSARAPSMLFRNMGDGTFRRVADFPDLRILGMGAAWGDYNNDGWLDLIVTGYNTLLLFRNEHGRLVRDSHFPDLKGFWTGASWGDYDRDGNLDLYVCGYVQYNARPEDSTTSSLQFGLEIPFTLNPSSFKPERNLLFHNNGNGTFTEIAAQLGVDDPQGRSLTALWHDFDDDGWLDLYVANDLSENKLYLNRRGRFVDSGSQALVAEYRGSMGLAAGDWDNDGDDDLFISHWIAQQYALYDSLLADTRRGKGASKETGSLPLRFMDQAEMAGIGQVSMKYIGWGAEWADFDNDGWLDLAVANGSTFQMTDNPHRLVPMDSFLFWNDHGRFFYNLAPWNKSLSKEHVSRGLAVADFDNDGSMDLLVVDRDHGVRLLHNQIGGGNWVELRLRNRAGKQKQATGFGDGTTVVVHSGGKILRRTISSASYLSQSSRILHFGLGSAATIDRAEVSWPGGGVQTFTDLNANTRFQLTEGDPLPAILPTGPVPQRPVTPPFTRIMSREETAEFWSKQREAMDAMKESNDVAKAVVLFRQALALNPEHEDSRYYLANCLAAQGDVAGALEQLAELIRINPGSHRAYQQRGLLLAESASTRTGLKAAEESLEKAYSINPEETGTMLILGELAVVLGDRATAERRLESVCRTNPRAVGAFYLRGYLAWKSGDRTRARELLEMARSARGRDWKPNGTVAEGEVHRQMHVEAALLSSYWDSWDGSPDPDKAFDKLAGSTVLRRPR